MLTFPMLSLSRLVSPRDVASATLFRSRGKWFRLPCFDAMLGADGLHFSTVSRSGQCLPSSAFPF